MGRQRGQGRTEGRVRRIEPGIGRHHPGARTHQERVAGEVAQAHGAEIDGTPVGAFGDAAATGWQFTHVGKYEARIVAANILGRRAEARYDAVPRATFTDPEVGAVGLTEAVMTLVDCLVMSDSPEVDCEIASAHLRRALMASCAWRTSVGGSWCSRTKRASTSSSDNRAYIAYRPI